MSPLARFFQRLSVNEAVLAALDHHLADGHTLTISPGGTLTAALANGTVLGEIDLTTGRLVATAQWVDLGGRAG